MKALIVGGASKAGIETIHQLLSQDWQVLCVDTLSSEHKRNIYPLLNDPHFTFYDVEGTPPPVIIDFVKAADLMLHFNVYSNSPLYS